MKIDKLTSKERMSNLILGKEIDRVPFISASTMYAGTISGLSSEEFFLNQQKSFDAQKLCIELHGCDGSPGFDLPGWIGWDFGSNLTFVEGAHVCIPKLEPIIKSKTDIDKLCMPDIHNAFAFNKRLEFYKIAKKEGLSASVPAGSPLEIVGEIVDTSLLMKWFYKEPELVHELLRLTTDYLLKVADLYIDEFGVDNCCASSNYPLESNTLISPKLFEKFSLPYIVEIHDKFKEKGISSYSVHLCGDHKRNIDYFKELNLPARSFVSVSEKLDIEIVAKSFGDDYIIGGNVPTHVIQSGTPNEVFNVSKDIIEKMKYHPGGFVLMPSCDLPPNTPPLNLYAMLKAVKTFGCY